MARPRVKPRVDEARAPAEVPVPDGPPWAWSGWRTSKGWELSMLLGAGGIDMDTAKNAKAKHRPTFYIHVHLYLKIFITYYR